MSLPGTLVAAGRQRSGQFLLKSFLQCLMLFCLASLWPGPHETMVPESPRTWTVAAGNRHRGQFAWNLFLLCLMIRRLPAQWPGPSPCHETTVPKSPGV